MSRFWESNADVKLNILDAIPTGSRWCWGNRVKIEVSSIVSVSIDRLSTASKKIKINRDRKW